MLSIKHLSKAYAKSNVLALDDLNLDLKPREVFGFLGPNGAGKTTTIKIITGILSFDQGRVHICGHDLKKDPIAAKRNLGYVADSHIIYDKLTGREYIDFIADINGIGLNERKERCDELLKRFNLTDAFDAKINTYSHGMKQKIAIIGALIHNPKLWVLDEPLTGLDPQSSFELKTLMRQHCDAGNTVFFSTHILEVAEKICDRVGIIHGGKLVMIGSVDEIKQASTDKSFEEIFLKITSEG